MSSYYVLPAVSGKDGHFSLSGALTVQDFSVTPLSGFPTAPLATPSQVPWLTFPPLHNSTNSVPQHSFLSPLTFPLSTLSDSDQVALVVKNPPANAGDKRDVGLIPGLGRCPGGGHDNPLHCSCLENPIDWGSLVRYTVHLHSGSQTYNTSLI